ncbi:MAG: nucleoside hydrolase [Ilumatobacteraceae bacterium]
MKINRRTNTTTRAVVLVATLVFGTVSCTSQDERDATASSARLHVVLDYSPTLSDAGALLYLASNPNVELLAVTLAGTGESDCDVGVRTTRSLLAIAGKPNVPVGCGRDAPLAEHRDWPEAWREEVNQWGDKMLPPVDEVPGLDAETLLVDVLTSASAPVTIVAVAPLTNLGAVLPAHPELVDKIEQIVIMGGAVEVSGNVEASPAAEWNIYIDPEAARRVFATGIPITLVPLDATNYVPWTERVLRRLATLEARAATTVHEMATSRATLSGFYLWDELAAIAAVQPTIVTIEQRSVRVDDDGAIVIDPNGVTINVAIHADPQTATEEFLRTLNGGLLAAIVPLTPSELDYMIAMNEADGHLSLNSSDIFTNFEASALSPRESAKAFANGFLEAIGKYAVELSAITPPAGVSDAHAEYVDNLVQVVDSKEQILAAIDKAEGADASELLQNATAMTPLPGLFEQQRKLCQTLEDYSFLHNGPRPCSSAANQ